MTRQAPNKQTDRNIPQYEVTRLGSKMFISSRNGGLFDLAIDVDMDVGK